MGTGLHQPGVWSVRGVGGLHSPVSPDPRHPYFLHSPPLAPYPTMPGMEERLNKYLAHAGLGSRRHCEELIAAGRVEVDGHKVRELGAKLDPEQQHVTVDGKPVRGERLVYWLLNKPRGCL